jgi:hypothetical protein
MLLVLLLLLEFWEEVELPTEEVALVGPVQF